MKNPATFVQPLSTAIIESTVAMKDKFMGEIWKSQLLGTGQQFKDPKALKLALF